MSRKLLVTGASGHVGLNLCKRLVQGGADVRATVRDRNDAEKTKTLWDMGIRDIVSLDVRNADAFVEAAKGIDTMFHVAATFRFVTSGAAADRSMIDDSIEGATSAIRAAARNRVRKVVLTSTIGALPMAKSRTAKMTEEDWNSDIFMPYIKAKTLAEKRAWQLAEELGVYLVTVLPAGIFGGYFDRPTQTTDLVEAIAKGGMRLGTFDKDVPFVDVSDLVDGHILAAEKDVHGRFILAADEFPSFSRFIDIMRDIDPGIKKPLMIIPEFMYPVVPLFDRVMSRLLGAPRLVTRDFVRFNRGHYFAASNERAKSVLGWTPKVSVEESVRQTMKQLRRIGRL